LKRKSTEFFFLSEKKCTIFVTMNELTATYQQNTTVLPEAYTAVETGSQKSPGKINGRFFQGLDYYFFGSLMPGRNMNASDYRFGFNGKESDPEWTGNPGVTYDYGFRIYDARIGKFLSVDPLTKSYPMLTPYQFASNTPIQAIDLDGLEARKVTKDNTVTFYVVIKVKNSSDVSNDVAQQNARSAAKQIESSYQGYDPETGKTYKTKVIIEYTDDVDSEKDYYIEFVNFCVDECNEGSAEAVGMVDEINDPETNRMQVVPEGQSPSRYFDDRTEEEVKRTAAHEFGHTVGLEHPASQQENPDKTDLEFGKENIMTRSGSGNKVNIDQLKIMEKNVKEIDQGSSPSREDIEFKSKFDEN
jgi:RHS repeat-associated protein